MSQQAEDKRAFQEAQANLDKCLLVESLLFLSKLRTQEVNADVSTQRCPSSSPQFGENSVLALEHVLQVEVLRNHDGVRHVLDALGVDGARVGAASLRRVLQAAQQSVVLKGGEEEPTIGAHWQ